MNIEKLLCEYEGIKKYGGGEDVEEFLSLLIDYIGKLGNEKSKLEYNEIMNVLLYLYNNGD